MTASGQQRRFIHEMTDFLQTQQRPVTASFSPTQQQALDNLFANFSDVLGDTNLGVFKDAAPIELEFKEGYKPSRVSRAPVVPIHQRAAVRKELESLLKEGIIRPIKPEIGRAHV